MWPTQAFEKQDIPETVVNGHKQQKSALSTKTIYPEKLDIVIIGGSLAGLWAAVTIKSLPIVTSITILERFNEDQLQDLGAGIRTNNEAIDALLEFTQNRPEKYATPLKAYHSLDISGKVIANTQTEGWTSTWGQLYRVLKNNLDADPKCSYRHGCTLQHLDEKNQTHMNLTYLGSDGEQHSMTANLIIGADGASSKVRSLVLPHVLRTGVGYGLYRGLVPISQLSQEAREIVINAGSFSWPTNSQFVSYPVPANDAAADEAEVMLNWGYYQHQTEDEIRQVLNDKYSHQHLFSLPAGGMRQQEIDKIQNKARQELPPQHCEFVVKTKEPFFQVITDSLSEKNCFYEGKLLLTGDAVGGQRPHTASAFLQCAFHGLMIRKLLEGEISQEQWIAETQSFSSILVKNGQELGKLLMGTMPLQEKVPEFLKLQIATQIALHTKWKDMIGIGTSTANI